MTCEVYLTGKWVNNNCDVHGTPFSDASYVPAEVFFFLVQYISFEAKKLQSCNGGNVFTFLKATSTVT